MKSPLRKRLPRELKGEIGKYLVVLILMIATIGFVSGFLVADGSMIKAYNEGYEKYKIEDGNFRVKKKITKAQQGNIEKNGVTLYENFYLEEALDNGSTMRIFKNREEINLVCLMEGKLPEKAGEMAIDRMYADNNKISVGDTLKSGSQKWKVTGFVALSDYSCLFQNNNDSMFDAIKFGVSVVTPEEFESLNQEKLQYSYSWVYDKAPKNEKQEKKMSEDLMEALGEEVTLESFVPQYLNQAITFTGDDMGALNKRRGRVLGMTPDHQGNTIIEADVPQLEIYGYSTDLRSMTGGSGEFSYEFARYEQAPGDIQAKEIEARASKVDKADV